MNYTFKITIELIDDEEDFVKEFNSKLLSIPINLLEVDSIQEQLHAELDTLIDAVLEEKK